MKRPKNPLPESACRCGAKCLLILPLLLLCRPAVSGQVLDSAASIQMQTLGLGDIDLSRKPVSDKIVLGANRVAENAEDIAVKTYIITREQIQQNGWSTLLDVLRTVPGFQVSEPANALLGEAFLMRGMLGNLYAKILINGVPILPSAAPGQPLGGNLPIKQAERIEIVMGPATTVYGNDALAGVINIVIAEVERPVEARASLSVGVPGLDEFHLMLAGKAGGSKRVLQYQLFGSSRQMKDRNLDFRDSLLSVDTNIVQGNANWQAVPGSTTPRLADYGHQSRLLGAALQLGGLRIMGMKMYRRDHAAQTQSPLEVSYSDPYTFVADDITNLQLQFDKTIERFWMHTNVSYLGYRIDENSAYVGVEHPVSNGRNFLYAASRDLLAEQLFNYKAQHWSVLLGGNYLRRSGDAFQSYLVHPFDETSVGYDSLANADMVENATSPGSNIGPKSVFNQYVFNDGGIFSQGTFHTKRLNLIAGLRVDQVDTVGRQLSWRVGGQVKATEHIRIRALASKAFRSPGTFYTFNNYMYMAVGNEPMPNYKRMMSQLQAEEILNAEAGITVSPAPWLQLELSGFVHRMDNKILFDQNIPTDSTGQGANVSLFLGYRNDTSTSVLGSVQASAHLDFDLFKADLSAQLNRGQEAVIGLDTVDAYTGVPSFQANAALHFEKENWFRLSLYGRYVGKVQSYYSEKVNDQLLTIPADGFYSVDAVLGRTFVKRIFLYLRVKNLTDTVTRGISTNFISTWQLKYLPQERRYFLVGVNFSL